MANKFEAIDRGYDPFDAPIPGESLTSDPDNPKPWERPPEFTTMEDALQDVFIRLTDEDNYGDFMDNIRNKTPLDDMTSLILFKGYMSGKWSVDLMYLLAEPLMYLLIALAEHNKIRDYVLYDGEESDVDEESVVSFLLDDAEAMRKSSKMPKPPMNKSAEQVLPSSLLSKVEQAPMADMTGE